MGKRRGNAKVSTPDDSIGKHPRIGGAEGEERTGAGENIGKNFLNAVPNSGKKVRAGCRVRV